MSHLATLENAVASVHAAQSSIRKTELAAQEAQILLPDLLSGRATWAALQRAVQALVSTVPKDHDVLIEVGGLRVLTAEFIEPHTFLFHGRDPAGHEASTVCHFTQLIANVIYIPKCGPERVVTGFSKPSPSE